MEVHPADGNVVVATASVTTSGAGLLKVSTTLRANSSEGDSQVAVRINGGAFTDHVMDLFTINGFTAAVSILAVAVSPGVAYTITITAAASVEMFIQTPTALLLEEIPSS